MYKPNCQTYQLKLITSNTWIGSTSRDKDYITEFQFMFVSSCGHECDVSLEEKKEHCMMLHENFIYILSWLVWRNSKKKDSSEEFHMEESDESSYHTCALSC